jgi:hypothetical protein
VYTLVECPSTSILIKSVQITILIDITNFNKIIFALCVVYAYEIR